MSAYRFSNILHRSVLAAFVMLASISLISCGGGGGSDDVNNNVSLPTSFTPSNQGFNDGIRAVAEAKDGSGDIYVGGGFTTYNGTAVGRIVRLNSDGTVDTAFVTGSGFNTFVNVIVAATDGSGDIYVGGNFTSYNGATINRIVRLNSDGSVDSAFASNSGTGFNNAVQTIAIDSTGVYVGGYFTSYAGNATAYNRIIRLSVDGAIDTNFNPGTGFDTTVFDITPDGVGNIYVGGQFTIYQGVANKYLTRLTATGAVDATFVMGTGFTNSSAGSVGNIALANDATGAIYVSGQFSDYNATTIRNIARINNDGTLDTTFSNTSFISSVSAVASAPDGSGDVYVGSYYRSPYDITRLNSDGTIDVAFDTASNTQAPGLMGFIFSTGVSAIVPSSDGSVYVAGSFVGYNGTPATNLVHLGNTGLVTNSYTGNLGFNGYVSALAQTSDGSGDIYVGGGFSSYNGTTVGGLARLKNNGILNTTYTAANGSGFDSYVEVIAPATDTSGDIYVSGAFSTFNGQPCSNIVRLNNDGTIDSGFSVVGAGFADNTIEVILPANDGTGSIYIGGTFTAYDTITANSIIRLKSDGSVDSGFVSSGFTLASAAASGVYSLAQAIDGTGDLFVGGGFDTYNGSAVAANIARLKSDGGVDASFATNSGTGFSGFDAIVTSIAVASDGSGDIYTAGRMVSQYNGLAANTLTRINADGTIDSSIAVTSPSSIVPTTDGTGDIYVGSFVPSNGSFLRLTSTGTVSATFNRGTGFNDRVEAMLLANDGTGNLYVGGRFSSYDHTTAYAIAAVKPDGSLF